MENTLYITGAGVSAESGIPTFRGEDGYWTIGSTNYTPQEMATRAMYTQQPREFLKWYYQRFVAYRHHGPNVIHHWLADKNLITQNIDGLDGKAGNSDYISIHGRIDRVTLFHRQGEPVDVLEAPWSEVDEENLEDSLMELFRIEGTPRLDHSLKPLVLLFDEYYTDLYRMSEAEVRMAEGPDDFHGDFLQCQHYLHRSAICSYEGASRRDRRSTSRSYSVSECHVS